jgi:hypothetical protein
VLSYASSYPSYSNKEDSLVSGWTTDLRKQLASDSINQDVREDLRQIIKTVASEMRAWEPGPNYIAPYSVEDISNVMASALDMGDKCLLLDVCDSCIGSPAGSIPLEALHHVAKALVVFDLKSFLPS